MKTYTKTIFTLTFLIALLVQCVFLIHAVKAAAMETTTPIIETTEQTTAEEPTSQKSYVISDLTPVTSRVVVLDPGHCNIHSGAKGYRLNEEKVVLDIAKACRNELNQYGNVTVYMTRETKACCSKLNLGDCLTARNNYAEQLRADFLVSFHINADDSPTKTGAMILPAYNSGYHDNVRLETQALGKIILKELSALGIKNTGFWLRKLPKERYANGSRADYYSIVRNGVLDNIPSLIVEHGYITNVYDCDKYFRTSAKRKQLGVADAKAIISYYGLKKNIFTGSFLKKGKATFYVNSENQKITGWIKNKNKWYYFHPSTGSMIKGFVTINKNKFYLDSNGAMKTGWFTVKGKSYFAKGNGTIVKNKILKLRGANYYFNSKGIQKKGWVTYKNKKYYFSRKTGSMLFGWHKIRKKYYFFSKKSGKLLNRKRK